MRRARFPTRARQRGVALIALAAVIAMGASWWLVSAVGNQTSRVAQKRAHNAEVLRLAKAALLGWAARQASDGSESNPGRLPCPEPAAAIGNADEEGKAAPNPAIGVSTCLAYGRLPWRTLGLDKLRDADGEPLWYVVSNGWYLPSSGTMLGINPNTAGGLSVNGTANAAVAFIVAPGAAMNVAPNANQLLAGCVTRTQSRTGSPPNALDYLECQNVAGQSLRTTVVDSAVNGVMNDQGVVVQASEVLGAVEGAVAARIRTQVVPQIQGVYSTSAWGATAATPIYPFPARFTDDGTLFNPDDYKGSVAAAGQGLLPLTRAQGCISGTERCDTGFVSWNTSSISVSKDSGLADISLSSCLASTSAVVSCSITFVTTCAAWSICVPSLRVRIQVTANNVGMTLKTLTTAGTTGGSSPTLEAPLQASGAAAADYRGSLSGLASVCWFVACAAVGSATVTIPISVFQDHPFLNPTTADAWYWFIQNKWHESTYYAVAANHLPSGAGHNCTATGPCLSVTGGSPASNIQSMMVLAGRSLTGAARPNANLADFLDLAENRNLDAVFQQNVASRTFNDRFIAVGNY